MAGWGALWGGGFVWGGINAGQQFACSLVEDRVLVQHPDATGERQLRDWICAYAEQDGEYLDVAKDVKDGFDPTTAVGAQLDLIGSVVGLPRSGDSDARYLILLDIQIKLLVSHLPRQPDWTGTINNLLKICRQFIGGVAGGPPAIILQGTPPYGYLLTVPGVSLADLAVLVRFLCKATWAGVLGQIIFNLDGLTFCNEIAADVAAPSLFCNEILADTPGAGVFDHVVVIGPDAC